MFSGLVRNAHLYCAVTLVPVLTVNTLRFLQVHTCFRDLPRSFQERFRNFRMSLMRVVSSYSWPIWLSGMFGINFPHVQNMIPRS